MELGRDSDTGGQVAKTEQFLCSTCEFQLLILQSHLIAVILKVKDKQMNPRVKKSNN